MSRPGLGAMVKTSHLTEWIWEACFSVWTPACSLWPPLQTNQSQLCLCHRAPCNLLPPLGSTTLPEDSPLPPYTHTHARVHAYILRGAGGHGSLCSLTTSATYLQHSLPCRLSPHLACVSAYCHPYQKVCSMKARASFCSRLRPQGHDSSRHRAGTLHSPE